MKDMEGENKERMFNRKLLEKRINELFNVDYKDNDVDLVEIDYEYCTITYLLPIRQDEYIFCFYHCVCIDRIIKELIQDIANNLEAMQGTINDTVKEVYSSLHKLTKEIRKEEVESESKGKYF